MHPLADFVKVISGGYRNGNHALIQIGDEVLVDETTNAAVAGIHLVAVFGNRVIRQYNYNVHYAVGASEGLARDIDSFPDGTLVIIAVRDEATRRFDKRGQTALFQIGAKIGLYRQTYRTSYLCIGTKGLEQGEAIEKIGMELLVHEGPKVGKRYKLRFPPTPKPKILNRPGLREGLMIDDTEILYYIPTTFDIKTSQYLFLIHDGEDWHRGDALQLIDIFKGIAQREKLVLVAPVFDCATNWKVNPKTDINEKGHFRDARIIKAINMWHFHDFMEVLAPMRSDVVLINAFKCFNEQLMKRDTFCMYGRGKGATYVCCFLYFHSDLVDRAAVSDAPLLTMPDRQLVWHKGIKLDHIRPQHYHYSLEDVLLKPAQLDKKISQMLGRSVFVITSGATSLDSKSATNQAASTVLASQPTSEPPETKPSNALDSDDKSPLGIAQSFVAAMKGEYNRLCEVGKHSPSDPFRIELHTVPKKDLDAGAHKAIELLFPGTNIRIGKKNGVESL